MRNNRPVARFGITFETKQTGRHSLHGFHQFGKGTLRVVRPYVSAVDRAEKVEFASTGGIPAGFGVSERDEVDIVNAFVGKAFSEFLL